MLYVCEPSVASSHIASSGFCEDSTKYIFLPDAALVTNVILLSVTAVILNAAPSVGTAPLFGLGFAFGCCINASYFTPSTVAPEPSFTGISISTSNLTMLSSPYTVPALRPLERSIDAVTVFACALLEKIPVNIDNGKIPTTISTAINNAVILRLVIFFITLLLLLLNGHAAFVLSISFLVQKINPKLMHITHFLLYTQLIFINFV